MESARTVFFLAKPLPVTVTFWPTRTVLLERLIFAAFFFFFFFFFFFSLLAAFSKTV